MIELKGKLIKRVRVSDCQHVISFSTNEGDISYRALGDCCSESWFADITGVDCLIGSIVLDVNKVPMDGYNVDDGRGRQEEDIAYGYKIITDKGYCYIVFRNSSNGYYGGEIEKFDEELPDGMELITEDWQA